MRPNSWVDLVSRIGGLERGTGLGLARPLWGLLAAGLLVAGCDLFGSEDANRPPEVAISAPDSGASYPEGEEIAFEGTASDPDGTLGNGSVVWRSDLDGQIGLGPSTTSSALSPGAHTVWLVATDEGGAADSASVAITVEDRPEASDLPYRYERTFEALTFERPTNMEPGPDGERFYLTEQKGLIRTFENDPAASAAPVMLDLTDRVLLEDDHTAEGLLGFALDPDFAQNGTFYVLYTAAGPQGSRSYSPEDTTTGVRSEIGRASCRERVYCEV